MKNLIERLRSVAVTSCQEAADALERLTTGDVEMPFVRVLAISDRAHIDLIAAMQDYGDRRAAAAVLTERERCAKALDALVAAIKKMHSAKGRYHMQLATCDLYELVGLSNTRPEK